MNATPYCTALASLNHVDNSGVLALSADEYNYLIGERLWLPTERPMVRKCVEAVCYGVLDYLGYPRFALPAEFVAAAIAYYVHPVNSMTACVVMEGVSSVENIINGVEIPLRASELFAHYIQCSAGQTKWVDSAQRSVETRLQQGSSDV